MRHKILKLLLIFLLAPYVLSIPYQLIHPPSTLMLYDIVRFRLPERDWVPLSAMSPALVSAVVTSEDAAFCDHWGIDFRQMGKSIERAEASNKPVKATSTISQQLAKNLFLWQGRSWTRKILELPLTFWLELTWSKRRILETYLNIVEWDEGVYGAQSAALHYFGVPASKISYGQAALLATTLPNPGNRNAARPGPAQLGMALQLGGRMAHGGPDLSCVR